MTDTTTNFDKAVDFIRSIGINIVFEKIDSDCFLPGLSIKSGNIIIDRDQLKFPGDIIHEAGHIAVVPAEERSTLDAATIESRKEREAEEMMSIAWSYAVCKHLAIDPYFVFHENGYRDGAKKIVEAFSTGRYFGVPMLQYVGMTVEGKKNQEGDGVYPKMKKWVR
jgi:hypothetical protein